MIQASNHINIAEKISQKHITEILPNEEHPYSLSSVPIGNNILSTRISHLNQSCLQQFLLKLSEQIGIDAYHHAEKKHPKVAYELFEAAKLVKRASEIFL